MITIVTHDLEKIAAEAKGKPTYAIAQLSSSSAFDPLRYVYVTSASKPADEDFDEVYQLRSTIIFASPRKEIAVPKLSDEYSSTIYTPRGTSSPSLFVKNEEKEVGIELKFRIDKNGQAHAIFSEEFRFENFVKYFDSLVYITQQMINDLYIRAGLEKTTAFGDVEMIIAPGGVSENYEDSAETGFALVEDEDFDDTQIVDDLSLHKDPERVMREILGPPRNSITSVNGGQRRVFHSRKTDRKKEGNPNGNHLRLIRFDKPEEDKD